MRGLSISVAPLAKCGSTDLGSLHFRYISPHQSPLLTIKGASSSVNLSYAMMSIPRISSLILLLMNVVFGDTVTNPISKPRTGSRQYDSNDTQNSISSLTREDRISLARRLLDTLSPAQASGGQCLFLNSNSVVRLITGFNFNENANLAAATAIQDYVISNTSNRQTLYQRISTVLPQ